MASPDVAVLPRLGSRRRDSLVVMVGDYREQLEAARDEAEDLRAQMRSMAAMAADRARALQLELQDELSEMQVQQEESLTELGVLRQQLNILSDELRALEAVQTNVVHAHGHRGLAVVSVHVTHHRRRKRLDRVHLRLQVLLRRRAGRAYVACRHVRHRP